MTTAWITPSMANRARARIVSFDGGSHLSLISQPDAVAAAILDALP